LKVKLYTFTFGPQLSYRKNDKVVPFVHALFGGGWASAGFEGVHYSKTAFVANIGGGLDWLAHKTCALRVIQLDLLVTRFVAGGVWRREDVHEPLNLRRLGGLLRRLHALPVPPGLAQVSFERQARRLEEQLEPCEVTDRGVRAVADGAFAALASGTPRLAPCHNDLHHLNVLDDGERLWLVDWEYGGCGDPLFDLASFACQHESTPGERDALLDACGWNGAHMRALLDAACTAFDYVQWLWYRLWVARLPEAAGEYGARAAAIHSRLLAVR
jgi:aminoglycoside phosphotransferase (APT) family kinase protein